MNLVKIGDDRIEKFGDIRAYVFEDEEFTSSRLNEMGRRLAGGLKSLGIGRGDHVVVSLSNSPESICLFWRDLAPRGGDRSHHVFAGRG